MEKTTTIIQDKIQTRATIPKKFVELKNIDSTFKANWKYNEKNKKLTAEVLSEEELEQIKREEQAE